MLFTCADLAKNLIELEEGNASSFDRAAMRLHLSLCERCRRYVDQLDQVRRALVSLRVPVATMEKETSGASLATALASFRAARDDEDLP